MLICAIVILVLIFNTEIFQVLLYHYDRGSDLWRIYFGIPLLFCAIQVYVILYYPGVCYSVLSRCMLFCTIQVYVILYYHGV